MVHLFSCGISSFNHHLHEDDEQVCSNTACSSTPTKARKFKPTCKRSRTKESKNLYANHGLDKFSSLLADHEEKKQKIYTRIGPEEISHIRFVYTKSNDCKPVIVRMKKKPEEEEGMEKIDKEVKSTPTTPKILEKEVQEPATTQLADFKDKNIDNKNKKKDKKRDNFKMSVWRRPSHYLPLVMILILLSVALFGKSFAIMCTSIVWYLVPTMNGGSSSVKKRARSKEKKEHVGVGAAGDKFMPSPTSVITGARNDKLWCGERHRKSVS